MFQEQIIEQDKEKTNSRSRSLRARRGVEFRQNMIETVEKSIMTGKKRFEGKMARRSKSLEQL